MYKYDVSTIGWNRNTDYWIRTKYKRDELDKCRAEVDLKLVERGYILLTI